MTLETLPSRFDRLRGYVEVDPENLRLLADAAEAASSEGRHADAVDMIERHTRIATPPASLINLLGLAALDEGRFEDASAVFAALHANAPEDAGLRFNLAWARSRLGDHEAVVELLQDGTASVVAGATALHIRALHHLGRLDDAMTLGSVIAETSADAETFGALSAVALDQGDIQLAREWAANAHGSAEALSTLGMAAMAEAREEEAINFFEAALSMQPDSARSLLGLGLGALERGEAVKASKALDRAAEIFGDHLGSWVAAGWAHLVAGDRQTARARFERALTLDDTFGESQGALAVLDFLDGDLAAARRGAEVAVRLDRRSLSGQLASSLVKEAEGDSAGAERIRERAMALPIGPQGQTLAQAVAVMARRR